MEVTKNNSKFAGKLALAKLFFVAAILIGSCFSVAKVNAGFNPQINYQGKLTDKNNVAVADDGYAMKFELYSASSGGSALWTETRTGANVVSTTNGLFSVLLGEVEALPSSYSFFAQDLYLEVSIGTSTPIVLTPRKHLGAVPAAFFANSAERFDGLATTSFLRTDIANASGTINNLTSTNFFSSYISSSGATSTNLFAAIFNTLSGIISSLTATIANITTLVFGTATGTDLSVTNLSATSTGNIKTLYTSSTESINTTSTNLYVSGNLNLNSSVTGVLQAANGLVSVTSTIGSGYLSSNVMLEGENISLLNNNAGYLTSATLTETDPIWSLVSTTVPYLSSQNTFSATNTFATDIAITGLTGNIISTNTVKLAIKDLDTRLYNQQNTTKEMTGFANRTDSSIAFDNGTRNFTITGTNFKVYSAGKEYVKNTESIEIDNTTALYFIYYDKTTGSLSKSTDFWSLTDGTIQIATIYWNADSQTGVLGEERHGLTMDGQTHEYLHLTVGARYQSGFTGTFDASRGTTTAGIIYDEDIANSHAQQTQFSVYSKIGSDWWFTAKQNAYYSMTGANLLYNNGGTATTTVTSNNYVAYWIFATNDPTTPIISIMGQRQDGTIAAARANNTYESLSFGTLPFSEMKVLYRVILRNTGATPTYQETQDLRSVSNLPAGTYVASAHSALTGLLNDDHTQYALLAGRDGGQSLFGSDTAGENLTLQGNSVDYGSLLLQPYGGMVAVGTTTGVVAGEYVFNVATSTGSNYLTVSSGGYLGVGTSTPNAYLDVYGASAANTLLRVATSTNQSIFVVNNNGDVSLSNSLTIGTLSGVLQATNGLVSVTSTISSTYLGSNVMLEGENVSLLNNDVGYMTTAFATSTYLLAAYASTTFGTLTYNSSTFLSLSNWYATTTDGLDQGSTNKYYADSLVSSYLTSSTTFPAFVNYWTKTGNDLYYTAGNVGVGTTSASLLGAYRMTVDGTSFFNGKLTVGTDSATASSSVEIYDQSFGVGGNVPTIQFNSPSFASNLYGKHVGILSDKLMIYNGNNTGAEILLFNNLVVASSTSIKLATTTNTLGFTNAVEYTFDDQVTVSGLKLVGGSNLALPGTPESGSSVVFVRGDYAYLALESPTSTNSFRIVDISDPTSPTVVGGAGLVLPTNARTIVVKGNYAYLGFNGMGQPATDRFRIIDISSSTNPTVVGGSGVSITATDNVRDLKVVGNYAYLALYGNDNVGIATIDISDPTNPVLLSENLNTQTKGHARGIDVRNGYAYLTLYGTSTGGIQDVLRIVDVRSPSNPVLVDPSGYNDSSIFWWGRNVTISGNYMYLAGGGWGTDPTNPNATDTFFQIFDISSSTSPTYVGGRNIHWPECNSAPAATMDVKISGNVAYVTGGCNSSNSFRSVTAIDITDKTNPVIGSTQLAGNSWGLFVSGRYVYVGFSNNDDNGYNGLRIYTLSGVNVGSGDFGGHVDVAQGLSVQDSAYFNESVVIGTTTESIYSLMVAGTSSLRDLIPETSLTYNLGNSVNRWLSLWTKILNIGTSSAWSIGPATDGSLAIYDTSDQTGNVRLTIATSTGYLGVGTSTPNAYLNVYGASAANTLLRVATSTNQSIFVVNNNGDVSLSNSLTIGTLNGVLQATNGLVSVTSTISSSYLGSNVMLEGENVSSLNNDVGYMTTAFATSTYLSLANWYATTTDGLAQGSTNKYYADSLVSGYLTGSTTFPAFVNYWTKTGNDLSYVAGNIGVGTTTPTVALVVDGAVNFQGINFATTTIGNYQSNIQFKETFYDLGVYGSYYSPMIYGNNTIPAAASVNTLFDNNISVVGRNDTDPTFKLLASNFEFIDMKYSSSSNELSYTLQTLGGSDTNVLYKFNGRTETNAVLGASSGQQNASQLSVSVNQSGSAGFVASSISISTTTVGSGIQLFSQWSVGGQSKFDVDLEGDTRVNDLLMDIDNTGTANLGISADADLLTLTSGMLTVNGTVSSSALLVNGNSTTTGIFSMLSPLAGVGGVDDGTFKIDWQYTGGMFGGYAPRMNFSSFALEVPLMFMDGTLGLVDVNNDSLNNKANLYFYNSSYSAVNGISSDAETDVMSFNDAVSYTFDNNVSITGNVTTTGYLTVGTAPVGANFTSGSLNIQNKLVVPYASTTALTVSGNSYLGTISSGTWNGAAVGLAYGGTATTTFSSGGVVFSDGSKLTQDTTNLFWDNTSKRLGVGTSSPSYNLHVYGSTTAGIAAIIENWADDDSILYFKNKNKRYQFQLDGDGSIGETNSFHFYDSTLSASRFTIGATTGYFGIGSTTPTSLLSVGANGLIADGSGNSTTSNSFYVGDTVKNLRTYMFPITSGGYTGSYLPVLKGLSYVTTTGVINSVNVGVGMEHGLQIIESDDGFPTNSTLINFTTRDLASNSGISWTSATDKMNFNSAATYDFDNQVSAGSGGVYGSNALTVNGTSRLAGYSEVVTGNTTNASFHIGEQDEEGGWFVSTIPSQIVMSGGADYVGSAWYARDTTASVLRLQSGNIIMNADSGLTVGNTFTPTYRFVVTPQGQMGLGLGNNISPSYDVQIATTTAGYATLFIQNQQGGATADVRLVMSNNSTLGSFTSASVIESDRTDVGGAGSTDMVFKNSLGTTLTERMRITAAGNVGIGTTSPTSRLFVTGASGTDVLTISSSTDDRIFYINNLGYVGIGTTTPGYDFQVMGKSLVVSKTGGALSSGSAGDNAGLLINTASDQTQIISYSSDVMNIATRWANDMVFKTNNSEKMRITSGGNIGIGTSTPANNLEVYNSAGTSTISIDAGTNRNSLLTLKYKSATKWNIYNNYSNSRLYVTSATGTGVYMISGGTSWTASSDIRLKENIKPIENALQKVMALNSYTYNFIGNSKTEAGLIAQEVYEQFPELVDTSGEYWGMNYDRVGAVLVNAIKEQQNEIINIKSSLANSSSTSLVVNSSPVGSDGSFTDLSVSSAATFYGTITVKGEAGFESKVVFKNDVDIEGKLYLDKDQTGTAIIPAGATTVQVVFEKPYRSVPKVVANLNLSTSSVFARFAVTQKTTSSFTIIIDAPAAEDLSFDWVAMGLRTEPAIGNVSESINEGSVAGAYESLENIGLDQLISDDNGILNLPVADLDNSDNMEETVPAESPATNEPEVPAATTEETSAPSEVPVATIETPAAETPAPVVESAPVEPAAETPAPVVE